MSDLDLCYMPATEALALFRARKLSPVELMKAVIARAERVNRKVNAFTFTHFDEALAAARKAEAKYAKGARGSARWKACRSASRTRAGSRASRPHTGR
jgi:amidase